MAFEQGLYQLLTEDPYVGAIVGKNVFCSQLPKGAAFPAIVFHTIATMPISDLDMTAGLEPRRVQVDCISAVDQFGARALARAVKNLLVDYQGTLPDGTVVSATILNDDPDLPYEVGALGYAFGVGVDIEMWVSETA